MQPRTHNLRGLLDFVVPIGRGLLDLNPLDQAAIATAPIPVAGDIVGLLADANMFINKPESRTLGNVALSAAGLLPFIPAPSVIKRAVKAGFKTDKISFHGTNKDFNKFDLSKGGDLNQGVGQLGISVSTDPKVASEFASRAGSRGANVVPLIFRSDRQAKIVLDGSETNREIAGVVLDAWERNFDSIKFTNYTTPAGVKGKEFTLIRSPEQLRSVNATFDPAKKNSRNLMAGLGAGGIGTGVIIQQSNEP